MEYAFYVTAVGVNLIWSIAEYAFYVTAPPTKDSIRQPSLTCNQYLDERCKNHPEGHGATHDSTPGIVSVQSDRILTPQTVMHVWNGSEAAPNSQSTIPDAGHAPPTTTHVRVSVQSDRTLTPSTGMHVWYGKRKCT